jgi:hypothetical protein
MHIYIAPRLIQQYTDENFACAAAPEIDPMFAVQDPWLQSYFMLLQSESRRLCSRTAAVTVLRRTVPTIAPAAENARHGEKRDGDSWDFGQKPVRC